jgi:hypothetical protein
MLGAAELMVLPGSMMISSPPTPLSPQSSFDRQDTAATPWTVADASTPTRGWLKPGLLFHLLPLVVRIWIMSSLGKPEIRDGRSSNIDRLKSKERRTIYMHKLQQTPQTGAQA